MKSLFHVELFSDNKDNNESVLQKLINQIIYNYKMIKYQEYKYVDMKIEQCELASLYMIKSSYELTTNIQINDMIDVLITRLNHKKTELLEYTKQLILEIIINDEKLNNVLDILKLYYNQSSFTIYDYCDMINRMTNYKLTTNDNVNTYIYDNVVNKRKLNILILYCDIMYLLTDMTKYYIILSTCKCLIDTLKKLRIFDKNMPLCHVCMVKYCMIYLITMYNKDTNNKYNDACNDLIALIQEVVMKMDTFTSKKILWCMWLMYYNKYSQQHLFLKRSCHIIINSISNDVGIDLQLLNNKFLNMCQKLC